MAYLRTKTLNGVQYDYLVKSVREGKKVHQVFVRYIGKHPPDEGLHPPGGAQQDACHPSGFSPPGGVDVRTRCVSLFSDLGCQQVVFNLRSKRYGAGRLCVATRNALRACQNPSCFYGRQAVGRIDGSLAKKEKALPGSIVNFVYDTL